MILLSKRFIEKHTLPSNKSNVRDHISKLIEIQDAGDVVMATKLTKEMLVPRGWQSMRVSDALNLFDMKVCKLS